VGVAYTLQIIGQKYTNPTLASIIMSLESVFSVISGAIFLNESMIAREIIGCVLVFIAVIIAQINPKEILESIKAKE
ncbi:MAG: DMT family transporter, partial [Tissierellia bacterium]|nr:DMT family transporter [Tissierellia bacterium]